MCFYQVDVSNCVILSFFNALFPCSLIRGEAKMKSAEISEKSYKCSGAGVWGKEEVSQDTMWSRRTLRDFISRNALGAKSGPPMNHFLRHPP